jgi:hypothetical protein
MIEGQLKGAVVMVQQQAQNIRQNFRNNLHDEMWNDSTFVRSDRTWYRSNSVRYMG